MSEIQQADPQGLSDHAVEEIRELLPLYPHPRSAVMPALDIAQEHIGYLTPRAMAQVADALELDPGYVEGVATFYSLFHLEPVGRHRFYICTNLSCMLRGAYDVLEHTNRATGVEATGGLSPDGLFSTEEVECLGACEYAPMMRLDGEYYYDLTPEKIDRLVGERKNPSRSGADVAAGAPEPAPARRQRTARKGTPKNA